LTEKEEAVAELEEMLEMSEEEAEEEEEEDKEVPREVAVPASTGGPRLADGA
jgi:hypothetical protein